MIVKDVDEVKIIIQAMNLDNVNAYYLMFGWKVDPSKQVVDIKKSSYFLGWAPKFFQMKDFLT